jgi:hypothetical protein
MSSSDSSLEFPKRAYQAIQDVYAKGVDLKKISKDFLESKIADYPDSFEFSDKSTRIYECADFFIDVYKWDKQVTTIHDHNFEGAFSLLSGHSTQIEFTKKVLDTSYEDIEFVKLTRKKITKVEPSDIHEIQYSNKFIHKIFHRPISLTICIRTFPVGNLKSYFYPSIGFSYLKSQDKFFKELRLTKDDDEVQKKLMSSSLCTILRFLRVNPVNSQMALKCIRAKDPAFCDKLEENLEAGRSFEKKLRLLKQVY